MLTRREIQLNLLEKFNELCQKANVKYVLYGHAAYLAYLNKPIEEMSSLEVLMCQGDAEKIADMLDDDAYYFEDSKSNLKFDRPYMLFGFRDSIDLKNIDVDFNTKRNIDNHCIRMLINFIEKPPSKIASVVLRSNRKVLKFKNMGNDFDYRGFKSKRKIANNVFKVINDERYNNMIYNFKKRNVSIDTWDDIKNYPFVKITGMAPVKSIIFESVAPVELDGVPSFVCEDFKLYSTYFYGNHWKIKKWPKVNNCTSNLISWDEFSKDPQVKKSFDEIQKRYDIIYSKRVGTIDNRNVIREMKKQIRQSKSIIYVRENTLQQKDKIMELYRSENMRGLESALNPLIRTLKNGINRGYTFSVDDDIDEIVDYYLRKTNDSELADEIKKFRIDI